MQKTVIIRSAMAVAVNSTACKLFAKECGIDRRIYSVEFVGDQVCISTRSVDRAVQLFQHRGRRIARKCWEWVRKKAEIWSSTPKPISIPASETGNLSLGNMMTQNTGLQIPSFPWMGGRIEMTRTLYDALGEMIDADQPMGLVRADNSIQLWVNPAAVQLFRLTSIEEAVPRDTSTDWLPVDLERKRQMIRDAGDRPFEITYSTQVGDGTWKRLTNRYRLVDNVYLVGSSLASEIIKAPELISA